MSQNTESNFAFFQKDSLPVSVSVLIARDFASLLRHIRRVAVVLGTDYEQKASDLGFVLGELMRHENHEGLPVVVLLIVVRVGKLVLEAVGRRLKRAAAGVGRAAERLQLGVGEPNHGRRIPAQRFL